MAARALHTGGAMPHPVRTIAASALAFFFCLFVSTVAGAQERQNSFGFETYFDGALGLRAFSMRGSVLRPNGGANPKSILAVPGEEISPGPALALDSRLGLALGPFCASVGLGFGVGGATTGTTFQLRDVVVRPSGGFANLDASVGAGGMFTVREWRIRLEGILGDELTGFGMERPGHPDTEIPAVNVDRWTIGPRLTFELPMADGMGGFGFVIQTDARSPKNLFFALQISSLGF